MSEPINDFTNPDRFLKPGERILSRDEVKHLDNSAMERLNQKRLHEMPHHVMPRDKTVYAPETEEDDLSRWVAEGGPE